MTNDEFFYTDPKLFRGSLMGGGPVLFSVYFYALASCSKNTGIVDLHPKMLEFLIGSEIKDIESAIARLTKSDKELGLGECDKPKIVHRSGYEYYVTDYKDFKYGPSEQTRREYFRQKQAESRARRSRKPASNAPVTVCNAGVMACNDV